MAFPTEKKKIPAWSAWLRRGLLAVLIAAAAWLWWELDKDALEPAGTPAPMPSPTAALSERALRERAYDKDVAALTALLESGAADADTQAQAARYLEELIAAHQGELAVEEALRRAGYQDCLVVVSGGAMTVMLPQSDLDAQNSAAVWSLCAAHANVGADEIRLMPLE